MDTKKSILIVEDSEFINKTIAKLLKASHGDKFNVFQALSLDEARVVLSNENIDFLLLDLFLPDGDGDELLVEINHKKTKVIVLTSDKDFMRREELFNKNILDYFSKENPIEFIISQIVKLIEKFENNHKFSILIGDDSLFIQKKLANIFKNRDYVVHIAGNGKAVLDTLESQKIDLLILDLEMPIISGQKIIYKIKQNKALENLPIIVISGTADKDLVANLLKNGADEFISKPFSTEEIIIKCELFLNLSHVTKELKYINLNLEQKIEDEIKKRNDQQKMLIQQTKKAAVGDMIDVIAHEWKQSINIISLLVESLCLQIGDYDCCFKEVEDFNENIKKNINHLLKTMDNFRSFFRPNREKYLFNLKHIFTTCYELLQSKLKIYSIDFIVDIDDNLYINGYENDLKHVFLNIISNAIDQIELNCINNGFIKISSIFDEAKNIVSISICDNGGGIKEELLTKIFDVNFTTKTLHGGSGIGLYISKLIIEDNFNGKIGAKNIDNGAKFTIILPIN
ncbi:MAG: response regulator [Campylobacterales bacterium]|nr:response regulator [Campylobacterales bacterium]